MELTKNNKIMSLILLMSCIFLGISIVLFAEETSESISKAINSCMTMIIPSLYGLMILSNFMIKSNVYILLGKPFSLISRYIFKLPEELFPILLISNFAGYPVGVLMIKQLIALNKIDKNTAENMMAFCYAPSPTFLMGLIGITLFNNMKTGMLIYLSCITANFITAFIMGIGKKVPQKTYNKVSVKFNGNIILSSVEESAKSLFKICIMIIFFSILISILNGLGIFTAADALFKEKCINVSDYIKSFFEISNISYAQKYCYNSLGIITAIASIGGLCIVMQTAALADGKIKLRKFLIARCVCAVISFVFINLFYIIFPIEINTLLTGTSISITENSSVLPSILLILMTILLLSKKV